MFLIIIGILGGKMFNDLKLCGIHNYLCIGREQMLVLMTSNCEVYTT